MAMHSANWLAVQLNDMAMHMPAQQGNSGTGTHHILALVFGCCRAVAALRLLLWLGLQLLLRRLLLWLRLWWLRLLLLDLQAQHVTCTNTTEHNAISGLTQLERIWTLSAALFKVCRVILVGLRDCSWTAARQPTTCSMYHPGQAAPDAHSTPHRTDGLDSEPSLLSHLAQSPPAECLHHATPVLSQRPESFHPH